MDRDSARRIRIAADGWGYRSTGWGGCLSRFRELSQIVSQLSQSNASTESSSGSGLEEVNIRGEGVSSDNKVSRPEWSSGPPASSRNDPRVTIRCVFVRQKCADSEAMNCLQYLVRFSPVDQIYQLAGAQL